MAITDSSTVEDIFDKTGYAAASEDDLAAWNELDCGDSNLCGTAESDGYIYNSAGLFGWESWEDFSDYCATATTECSEEYAY